MLEFLVCRECLGVHVLAVPPLELACDGPHVLLNDPVHALKVREADLCA
jgi:hypothetical protein